MDLLVVSISFPVLPRPLLNILPMPPLNLEPTPTRNFFLPPGKKTGFKVVICQQPVRARMNGLGEEGSHARPIDPPPVVKLQKLEGGPSRAELRSLILQCTVWNEEGTKMIVGITDDINGVESGEEVAIQSGERHGVPMTGVRSANAKNLKDQHGNRGYFYIFPHLFIRVAGRYRLKFDLVIPPGSGKEGPYQMVGECLSDVFVVYAAKRFPGMMQSTHLTKAFEKQGVKVRSEGRSLDTISEE